MDAQAAENNMTIGCKPVRGLPFLCGNAKRLSFPLVLLIVTSGRLPVATLLLTVPQDLLRAVKSSMQISKTVNMRTLCVAFAFGLTAGHRHCQGLQDRCSARCVRRVDSGTRFQ